MFGSDKMGGPGFVADFPKLPKPQGTWEDRGWESIDHSQGCLLSNMLPGRSPSTVKLLFTEMNTILATFDVH